MGHGINRREDNVLDTAFHLRFVERLYDGSPRWWSDDWRKHTTLVKGKYGSRLDREPGVRDAIYLAHDYREKFFNFSVPILVTCINPDCPLRSWFMVERLWTGKHSFKLQCWEVLNETQAQVQLETEYTDSKQQEIRDGHPLMASGHMPELHQQCAQCGHKRAIFGLSEVQEKWVYVLKESGNSLMPHLEIEIKRPSSGLIHSHYGNGRFNDKTQPFDGYLTLRNIKDHVWHFFLSPIRLGPRALSLLSQAPKEDPNYVNSRNAADPARWKVGVNPELQPWTATVKRRFQSRQVKTPYEFIPLVDAFSWVSQVVEFDYLPIAVAQQKLIQDSDEQAKSFISATLAQVIGRRQMSENPPKFVEDQWSVKDDTVETPEEFHSSGNIAKAWVDRYQAALQFLTDETNYACCRAFFPVRFSLAHRVIELACQENTKDSEFLAFGLTHWAHILRDMLLCRAGEAFTVWLAKNKEAGERIPQKNVLGGAGLEPGSKSAQEIGPGLPVHIFVYLSPVLIADSNNPAQDLAKYLEKIDIKASKLGVKEIQSVKDLALDISGKYVDNYVKKLPKELDPSELHAASRASSWQARIQSLSSFKDVEKICSLLAAVAEYGKKGGRYQSEWDRYSRGKEKIETPVKVAEFLTEKTHKLIKAGLTGDALEVAEKLEAKGIATLTAEEAELLSASRSLGAFRVVGVGVRLLAGPVGLVLGGCEVAIQFGEMGHAMESGDPGAAAAHGIQAVAGILIIAVAGAECVALVTGAGVAAWAGPVGWIAAALMLIGAVVMSFCAKNDLQLFAKHCFLGEDWGEGGQETTGKAWMGILGWAAFKSHKNARLALLRMLTSYTTHMFPAYQNGITIYPSYVPAGAFFKVEADVTPVGQDSPKETYKAIILPTYGTTGDYRWDGPQPRYDSFIRVVRNGSQVSSIVIEPRPVSFPFHVNYRFRIRLLYDPLGQNALPATVKWVENSDIDMHGIYSEKSSSDAEAEGE